MVLGKKLAALPLALPYHCGCGVKDENLKSDPLVNADGTAPVGKTLVAPAPPEGFTLLDNKDILAANGLYYASRVSGEPQPYENSEGKMAVFLAGLLILLMLFTAFWPQVVLFEESNLHRLQNAVLFCLKYGRQVLGTAVLQLAWWLLFVLFLPWTGFLVPFLGVWFIWFVCFFLLYNDFNAAYGIEEKISQQFPEQTPRYDE